MRGFVPYYCPAVALWRPNRADRRLHRERAAAAMRFSSSISTRAPAHLLRRSNSCTPPANRLEPLPPERIEQRKAAVADAWRKQTVWTDCAARSLLEWIAEQRARELVQIINNIGWRLRFDLGLRPAAGAPLTMDSIGLGPARSLRAAASAARSEVPRTDVGGNALSGAAVRCPPASARPRAY